MMLEEVYKAIRRKIVSVGILPTMKLIVGHFITRIFYREELLFYVNIQSYSLNPNEIAENIVTKEVKIFSDLSTNDITSIKEYAGEKYVTESKKRLANNWRLFLAYINDELVGVAWTFTNASDLKTKIVPLLDADIAIIDCWTVPLFRGRSVYPFLLSFIATRFKEEKFERVFGYVNERNIASIKGLKKAGYRNLMNYKVYYLFRNEVVIWKPKSKRGASYP